MDGKTNSFEFEMQKIKKIHNNLEQVRSDLIKLNQANGNLQRYLSIKNEIEQNGWAAVCEKYHPDSNMDDPAAFELFELYKYVHSVMEK